MKKIVLSLILCFFSLLVIFPQVSLASQPLEQAVVITNQNHWSLRHVIREMYKENINYKQEYTLRDFQKKVCSMNKRITKGWCGPKTLRKHVAVGKTMFFPALPEATSGLTMKEVFDGNILLQGKYSDADGNPSFDLFRVAVCKNNGISGNGCSAEEFDRITTTSDIEISNLMPPTYIALADEDVSVSDSPRINAGQIIALSTSDGEQYYRLIE